MADHYKLTNYALAPSGIVHRIATTTRNEISALQAFGRLTEIHRHEFKDGVVAKHDLRQRPYEKVFGHLLTHEIQNVFFEANGTIVDHLSAKAFFEAISYTEAKKKLCQSRQRKIGRLQVRDGNRFAWLDTSPFRVELAPPVEA